MKKANHPFVVEFRRKRVVVHPGKRALSPVEGIAKEKTRRSARYPADNAGSIRFRRKMVLKSCAAGVR